MRGQRHAPAALYPRERPGTYCTGGWVDPRAGLDKCGKSRPPPGFDPRAVQPVVQSLYRLSYRAHTDFYSTSFFTRSFHLPSPSFSSTTCQNIPNICGLFCAVPTFQRHRKQCSRCCTWLVSSLNLRRCNFPEEYSNIEVQQDAYITEFILSDNCSTCFGYRYHPSSGAQNNCNYGIW